MIIISDEKVQYTQLIHCQTYYKKKAMGIEDRKCIICNQSFRKGQYILCGWHGNTSHKVHAQCQQKRNRHNCSVCIDSTAMRNKFVEELVSKEHQPEDEAITIAGYLYNFLYKI